MHEKRQRLFCGNIRTSLTFIEGDVAPLSSLLGVVLAIKRKRERERRRGRERERERERERPLPSRRWQTRENRGRSTLITLYDAI